MRYVEAALRGALRCVLLAGLAGCAAVDAPLKTMQQGPVATGGAAPASDAAPPEAPVAPATQRAFDDAARALRAGRVDEAERGFRALVQANPELGGPHANLGLIHARAGRLSEAAAEFEQATRLNPRQPIYFNQLGVTYRQLGRFDRAREAYQRAIALDANYAAACLNLGILNDLYLNDGARALALYERYLALTPGGDPMVTKWVADLKHRKPVAVAANRKEKA